MGNFMNCVGKWLAVRSTPRKAVSLLFMVVVSIYLFLGLLVAVHRFLGIPAGVVILVAMAITTPIRLSAAPARSILRKSHRAVAFYGLMMLGTGYRFASPTPVLIALAIFVYWALVLLIRKT
jgi:chromate transport protein ChrA